MSRARSRALRESRRADRGRRLGDGLEPAGAGSGRRARRTSAVRSNSSSPTGHVRRSTGRPRGASRPPSCPGGDDATLEETLTAVGAEIVVLAGYMRVVGPRVLAAFGGRILNVHPSLLPAFPGAHAVADALAHGVTVTGCTVHLVDQTLDGGPILVQEAVPVVPGDDEASLAARIHAVEHRLLPWAVALLASGAVGIDGRRARVETDRAEREHHRSRDGRCCPSRTRPGWSSSGGVSSATASSSCRPAGRPARCVTPGCRSPTWRP